MLFILMITATLFIPTEVAVAQDLEDELDLIRKEKEKTQERLGEIKKEEEEYFNSRTKLANQFYVLFYI